MVSPMVLLKRLHVTYPIEYEVLRNVSIITHDRFAACMYTRHIVYNPGNVGKGVK